MNSNLQLPNLPLAQPAHRCKIAIVGDIHDQWDQADEAALKHLGVDLVLLVGDFGNESVEIVRAIAQLDLPKAAIFGNHDAWFTATAWGRGLRTHSEDRVELQMELLKDCHVGFGKLDFHALGLTVVGSRPFSWGGPSWRNRRFYKRRFGLKGFAESTARIVAAAATAAYPTVIVIGHSGPQGLGDQPEDICGRDWKPMGGDYGDPDLTAAIQQMRATGQQIPLMAFGHMHHSLRHTQSRLRTPLVQDDSGTVYLNAARVPRIISTPTGARRNFSLVTLEAGVVTEASLVWIDENFDISEQILYPVAAISETGLASDQSELVI